MATLEESFKKANASHSHSHSHPTEPPGTYDDHEFATEEQHIALRTCTWFLSKTNTGLDYIDMDRTYSTMSQSRNRYQRMLYDKLECLAVLLERHHESISLVPTDKNATRAFISQSYSTLPPVTFDHLELDGESLEHFGPALGLSRTTDHIKQQDQKPYHANLFKATPNDYPVLSEEQPLTSYGHYLMRHSQGQVDEKFFVSGVSFSQHCGNVIDAIKRTHQQGLEPKDLLVAHNSLSRYIYFSSVVSVQDRMRRGFTEFPFGKYLTLPVVTIIMHDAAAQEMPFEFRDHHSQLCKFERSSQITPQQRRLVLIMLESLEQCGIQHLHLRYGCPDSLSEREYFYDRTGRTMFHTLLSSILEGLYHHVNSLVRAKRTAMETRNSVSIQRMDEIAQDVGFHTARTSKYFQMLEILRSEFDDFLNAHLTWIARVFEYRKITAVEMEMADRPEGLFDEFSPLARDVSDPTWTLSCLHWLRLLCLQETSMKALRHPLTAGFRERVLSEHIVKSKFSCVTISPPSHPMQTTPVREWIMEKGFNTEQTSRALQWLFERGKLANAEEANQPEFTGCLHAQTLQMLLIRLGEPEPDQRHRPSRETATGQNGSKHQEQDPSVCLPREAITTKMARGRGLMVVGNKPFCAACRTVVNYSLGYHGLDAQYFCHRGSRREWTQFDLPPWTPRDVMSDVLVEAERVAVLRIFRMTRSDMLDIPLPYQDLFSCFPRLRPGCVSIDQPSVDGDQEMTEEDIPQWARVFEASPPSMHEGNASSDVLDGDWPMELPVSQMSQCQDNDGASPSPAMDLKDLG